MKQFRMLNSLLVQLIALSVLVGTAFAVPESSGVRITDVTTSSFSVVWMTDVPAEPDVKVYSDVAMFDDITSKVVITPMPAWNSQVVPYARAKGIMKVRVSGLSASSRYYVRTVTRDPGNPDSIGYSGPYEVLTSAQVATYIISGGTPSGFSNDLASFNVYLRPSDSNSGSGIGDLVILETENSPYPISAFTGDSIGAPESILDMNNFYDTGGTSLALMGGEKVILRVYRGGGLSTLVHYRRIPQNGGLAYVVEPEKGFFADIDLDGKIDDADFSIFKEHYRTGPDDSAYNPDFNFVEDPEQKIDVRDFSIFSSEYGRTDVQ